MIDGGNEKPPEQPIAGADGYWILKKALPGSIVVPSFDIITE